MIERAKLSTLWASVTEVLTRLEQMQELQQEQRSLLDLIAGRIEQRRLEMENSLGDLTVAERLSITARATGSLRRQLINESETKRRDILRQAVRAVEEIDAIEPHYGSAIQMLMRNSLGSDRRSVFSRQIANSGSAELASLATFCAATKDADLAAALCSRNAVLKPSERSFSSSELAHALCGEDFEKVSSAISETKIVGQEIINADRAFLSRRNSTGDKIAVALMRAPIDEEH